MEIWLVVLLLVVTAGVSVGLGYFYRKHIAEAKVEKAEEAVKRLIVDAQKKAEAVKKETILEAKEEVHALRTEFERESKERRNEIQRIERRLIQREETLDKKVANVEAKEEQVNKRLKEISKRKEEIDQTFAEQIEQLEKISGMTNEDAKNLLLEKVEQETRRDMAIYVREIEGRAKEEADKKSREIIANAIQKYAADHVAENTVSVVSLPNDEMKGT